MYALLFFLKFENFLNFQIVYFIKNIMVSCLLSNIFQKETYLLTFFVDSSFHFSNYFYVVKVFENCKSNMVSYSISPTPSIDLKFQNLLSKPFMWRSVRKLSTRQSSASNRMRIINFQIEK